MILLFEIARRLKVTTEDPSEKKEKYDVLPIGSAIAKFVKLLELGEAKTCGFEDVPFFWKGRFHCFTGEPEVRRKAIVNINDAILANITKSNTVKDARHIKKLQLTEEYHLTELQELFSKKKKKKKNK